VLERIGQRLRASELAAEYRFTKVDDTWREFREGRPLGGGRRRS
jgi:hypothetical protein